MTPMNADPSPQLVPATALGRAVQVTVGPAAPAPAGHRERHRQTNWLRDVILGGQDGLVNILGIILGVFAGGGSTAVLLAAGFAAAITGGGAVSALGSDVPIDTDSGTNAINLPAGSGGNPGATETYCFEVKLDPDATLDELTALQTGAATANWVFEGVAVEAS